MTGLHPETLEACHEEIDRLRDNNSRLEKQNTALASDLGNAHRMVAKLAKENQAHPLVVQTRADPEVVHSTIREAYGGPLIVIHEPLADELVEAIDRLIQSLDYLPRTLRGGD